MAVFINYMYSVVTLSVFTACYGLELSDTCRNFSLEFINYTNYFRIKHTTVLAPFPLWNLLFNMAFAASGVSAKQMRDSLKLSGENNENALIKANKNLNKQVLQNDTTDVRLTSLTYMFWADDFQVNAEFKAILNYALEIESEVLNFSDPTTAAAMANSFSANTKLKFYDVYGQTDFNISRMILTSLTSFEGLWTMPFDAADTTIEPFYNENGEIIRNIYMMKQRNKFPFTNIKELGAFVLQMPYGSSDKYCMLILLPAPGNTIGEICQNLVHNFTLTDIFHKLHNDTQKYGLEDIDIKIPRFQIITNRISGVLNNIGANDILDLELANFSRATSETIFVSKVKYNINIRVTESGTSASDSTTALFADRISSSLGPLGTAAYKPIKSYPVYSPGFIANRPFIFYLLEKKTLTIVYGGAYSDLIVFT